MGWIKSVIRGVGKAVGGNKLIGSSLDPLSIGTSIASDYALGRLTKGGGRGRVGRSPEVKTAKVERRNLVQEAKPLGKEAVRTAKQQGKQIVRDARQDARERIQQERADRRAARTAGPAAITGGTASLRPTAPGPTRVFKTGGSVMKKKDMMDMEGRALKRKTADAKGRAMKKTASKTGKTGYGGVVAMGMKKGGSAKKGK